jgi:hypothetical protein
LHGKAAFVRASQFMSLFSQRHRLYKAPPPGAHSNFISFQYNFPRSQVIFFFLCSTWRSNHVRITIISLLFKGDILQGNGEFCDGQHVRPLRWCRRRGCDATRETIARLLPPLWRERLNLAIAPLAKPALYLYSRINAFALLICVNPTPISNERAARSTCPAFF